MLLVVCSVAFRGGASIGSREWLHLCVEIKEMVSSGRSVTLSLTLVQALLDTHNESLDKTKVSKQLNGQSRDGEVCRCVETRIDNGTCRS